MINLKILYCTPLDGDYYINWDFSFKHLNNTEN